MYYRSEPVSCEHFLQYLDKLPWCKQSENKLIAVHHCSPQVNEILKQHDHNIKVHPGGIPMKLNKSTLSMLEDRFAQEEPVPLLLVWTDAGIEMSFRTHKSADFPYDMWQSPAAAAYERFSLLIVANDLGERFTACLKKHLATANTCPTTIAAL